MLYHVPEVLVKKGTDAWTEARQSGPRLALQHKATLGDAQEEEPKDHHGRGQITTVQSQKMWMLLYRSKSFAASGNGRGQGGQRVFTLFTTCCWSFSGLRHEDV